MSGNADSPSPSTERPVDNPSDLPASENAAKRVPARANSFDRTLNPAHDAMRKNLANALESAVKHSQEYPVGPLQVSSLATKPAKTAAWLGELFGEDVHKAAQFYTVISTYTDLRVKLFAEEDMGNYVIDRKTGVKQWENMPLYVRIGMHLLFHGPAGIRFVTWGWIRKVLKEQTIKQGKIYDNTDPSFVLAHIKSFIATYSIDTSELLEKDLTKYPTFNAFFSRKLKLNARPPASPKNPAIISSAADSRLTVFPTVEEAKKFWIKGKHFTISSLLQDQQLVSSLGAQPSLAISRLAPQDYHRIHSPVSGTIRKITHIPGEYYTVNPQAINEDLDVFTTNTRSVVILDARISKDADATIPIALVAVGALLVGSIFWDKKEGDDVVRGEGLGYFAYGGSTVIAIFPAACHVKFDEDLLKASESSIEVLVKVGEKVAAVEPV